MPAAMGKHVRAGVVLAGFALTAGWLLRKAFPPTNCPNCGSRAWKRMGGGLKRCTRCSYSFFAQLRNPTPPNQTDPSTLH
jgi:transposase-like protein